MTMSFVHIHNSAKFTTEICVIDYTAFMQLLHNLDFGGGRSYKSLCKMCHKLLSEMYTEVVWH